MGFDHALGFVPRGRMITGSVLTGSQSHRIAGTVAKADSDSDSDSVRPNNVEWSQWPRRLGLKAARIARLCTKRVRSSTKSAMIHDP